MPFKKKKFSTEYCLDVNTKLETTLKNISQHYDETSVEELNKDEKDFFVLS